MQSRLEKSEWETLYWWPITKVGLDVVLAAEQLFLCCSSVDLRWVVGPHNSFVVFLGQAFKGPRRPPIALVRGNHDGDAAVSNRYGGVGWCRWVCSL